MAQATIQMDCPRCRETLSLDAGFAGGVCRCSACGAMMTVPRHPGSEAPQRVVRPEAPESERRDDHEAAPDAETADDTPPWRTESGEPVQVAEATVPVAAATRRKARLVTIAGFSVVVSILVGVSILAIILLSDGEGDTTAALVEEFGYDPELNPFTAEEANVLGLSLTRRDAVVVDASSSSEAWLALVGENVAEAVSKLPGRASLAVVVATDGAPRWLTPAETLARVSELDSAALVEQAEAVRAAGRSTPAPAIEAAKRAGADRVVFVLGRALAMAEADAVAAALGDDPPRLDVVLIDVGDPSSARRLAEDSGGRAIELSSDKLARWYRQAR